MLFPKHQLAEREGIEPPHVRRGHGLASQRFTAQPPLRADQILGDGLGEDDELGCRPVRLATAIFRVLFMSNMSSSYQPTLRQPKGTFNE